MNPTFVWTPRDESTAERLTISSSEGGLTRLQSQFVTDRELSLSTGGSAVTIVRDSFFVYELEFTPFNKSSDPGTWQELSSFISHANAGGEFQYLSEGATTPIAGRNDLDTTLSSAVVQNATSLTLASTTRLSAGDFIYIEDANDQTKWEIREVDTVATPIVVAEGVSHSYASGSTVRHWENFPKCIALDIEWQERRAGQGANLWDFAMKFRTVR